MLQDQIIEQITKRMSTLIKNGTRLAKQFDPRNLNSEQAFFLGESTTKLTKLPRVRCIMYKTLFLWE